MCAARLQDMNNKSHQTATALDGPSEEKLMCKTQTLIHNEQFQCLACFLFEYVFDDKICGEKTVERRQ